jgi:hypothetical protein
MTGLFVSYRTSDGSAWARLLAENLTARFGPTTVFMDTEGGLKPGDPFPEVLADALGSCQALLAVIGPNWVRASDDAGRRLIDLPGDWVRKEITGALGRNIPVVPVLVGGAPYLKESELPEDLRPLAKRTAAELSEKGWGRDVGALALRLTELTKLRTVDDVAAASSGLGLLRALFARVPAVAASVSASREVIENTSRQLRKLQLHKSLHDELHTIEAGCLQPLEAASGGSLRLYKVTFTGAAGRIKAELATGETTLRDELLERLEGVSEAFQRAAAVSAAAEARAELLAALQLLLTGLAPRLDHGIAEAAKDVDLDRLLALLDDVRAKLPAAPRGADPELAPLVEGTASLHRLRDELAARVEEHGKLQVLDSRLRTACVAGLPAASLAAEWGRIKKVAAQLPAMPLTPELRDQAADLAASAADVDAAFAAGDLSAPDPLRDHFTLVSRVFRDVDRALKTYSMRLAEVSQPLELVLDMLGPATPAAQA